MNFYKKGILFPHKPPKTKYKKVVYAFWTGSNKMSWIRSKNTKEAHEFFKKRDIELRLITPRNLHFYIKKAGVELHEGYKYLSATHKSDYLRCYFMHFFGGGYTDIKPVCGEWDKSFDKIIASNPQIYATSRPVIPAELPHPYSHLGGIRKFTYLRPDAVVRCRALNTQAFIFKQNTPFTQEWYTKLMSKMDELLEKLKNSPKYPVGWYDILAYIFLPICLKYNKNILFSWFGHVPGGGYKLKNDTNDNTGARQF